MSLRVGKRLRQLSQAFSWLLLAALGNGAELHALTVEGRVIDGSGKAMPGISVSITALACSTDDRAETASGLTDTDGRYRFIGIEPGLWTIAVRTKGESSGRLERRLLPLLHDRRVPPLELPGTEALALRLVDGGDTPLAGLTFEQRRRDDFGEMLWRAESDENGVVSSPWPEKLEDAGARRGEIVWEIVEAGSQELVLERVGLSTTKAPALREREVTVREKDAAAIAGAVVWSRGEICDRWSVTDESGRVRLSVPSVGGTVKAQAAGFSPSEVPTSSATSLTLELDRAQAMLLGRVLDRDGAPIEDALITWRLAGRSAVSGADGLFRLRDLPTVMPATVTVEARNYLPLQARLRTRRLENPVGDAEAKLTLLKPWTLEGRVLSSSGQPVQRCRVTVGSDSALGTECDDRGRFSLASVDSGWQLIFIETADSAASVEVELGKASPNPLSLGDLRMGPSGVVQGWAIDAGTGAPIEGVEVFAASGPEPKGLFKRDAAHRPEVPVAARSDASGHFRIAGASALVPVFLELWHPSFAPKQLEVSVAEGGTTELTVALDLAAYTELTLTDEASGEPVAGASVSAQLDGKSSPFFRGGRSFLYSDFEGRVRARVEPEAGIRLRIVHPEYAWEELELEIETAGVTRFDVALVRATHLVGKVYDVAGRVLTRGHVVAETADGESMPFWRDSLGPTGSFDIAGVRPGLGKLRIIGFDNELIEIVSVIFEPGRQEVDVLLSRGSPLPEEAADGGF